MRRPILLSWSGLMALWLAAAPALADVPISEEARRHFNAGVAYLQDPDGARYAEAHQEFLTAYRISPSWKMLGNLGIAAMKLERDGEAVDAFTRYLQEGAAELDPAEQEQITRDLNTLKASLATINVEVVPGGAVIIDERIPLTGTPIVNRYGPVSGPLTLGVKAGRHRFTAQLQGYDAATWEIDATAGSTQSHSFQLRKTPPPSQAQAVNSSFGETGQDRPNSGLRIASYAAFGVGIVGLAGGTFLALSAQSKADEAEDLCGGPLSACALDEGSPDADEVVKLNDDSGSLKTLSLVGFGVGAAGVVAGVTLFVFSSSSGKSAASYEKTPSLTPWVGVRSVGVTGRF